MANYLLGILGLLMVIASFLCLQPRP